ncbi:MAG: right-handed parallel beta-helix repeat-containing protein [Alistipes sp.]|nr:right-handed parallel beta-helix repeat-containing protein [Alistipes sp.]
MKQFRFALCWLTFLWGTACTNEVPIRIDLADYREVYDPSDMTPFIAALLDTIPTQQAVAIHFPKDIYHFHPKLAYGKYHCVTNHDNGYRYFAFPLIGRSGVEIDGGGSEFLFHGKMIPFLIERSERVCLRNFTVDWPTPFVVEGRVVASDAATGAVEIEVPEEFPAVVENGKLIMRGEGWEERNAGENIVFDPITQATAYRSNDYYIPKPDNFDLRVTELAPRHYRLHTRFVRALPPVGSVLTFKGLFTQNRHSPAIHATASSDVLVEDVTIHHAGGMGLIAEKTVNVTVRRMQVVLREDSPRMITTTADATHFCNCRGLVLIEDCRFENMLDDATNVHGSYVRVAEVSASDELLVRINHPQQAGYEFASAGDVLSVVDGETLLPKGVLHVVAAEMLNAHYTRLRLEEQVAEAVAVGDGLENVSWYPELIFRNNVVRNNRARSILVSTPRKVLIEGNIFSSMMAGILFEGDMDHWYESGAVHDVTIRNNTFLDGAYGGGDYPTIHINPHQKRMEEGRYYERNITIEQNRFCTFNEQLLKAQSVDGLIFRNNRIEQSTTYPPYNNLPTVSVSHARGVVIRENDYRKSGEMQVVLDNVEP